MGEVGTAAPRGPLCLCRLFVCGCKESSILPGEELLEHPSASLVVDTLVRQQMFVFVCVFLDLPLEVEGEDMREGEVRVRESRSTPSYLCSPPLSISLDMWFVECVF